MSVVKGKLGLEAKLFIRVQRANPTWRTRLADFIWYFRSA